MGTSYVISVLYASGCYRHIRISSKASLLRLHRAILEAFEIHHDQLHAFFMNNRSTSTADCYYAKKANTGRSTSDYKLEQLGLTAGKKFKYRLEIGEMHWTFQCRVLRELPQTTRKPEVVRSVGDAPALWNLEDFLPEIYSDERLDQLWAQVSLPEQTVREVSDYVAAAANLYGVISVNNLLQIYNRQHDLPISEEAFLELLEILRHEEHHYVICGEEAFYWVKREAPPLFRKIIHVALLEIDVSFYEAVRDGQIGKDYCILPRREFLRYADDRYYEQTPYTRALERFLTGKGLTAGTARGVIAALSYMLQLEIDSDVMLSTLASLGIVVSGEDDLNEIIEIFQNFHNHTRLWYNCGHTPAELAAKPSVAIPSAK